MKRQNLKGAVRYIQYRLLMRWKEKEFMKMKKAARMFTSVVMVIIVSITMVFGLSAIGDDFSVIVYAADNLTDSITGVTLKDTNGD